MKVKKIAKRILAFGAGATMLGATVMGAMAADLGNYPDMFVSDGTFNGLLVVGENAAAVDNLALTDIASSMKTTKAVAASTTTVEGDAWLVETSAKKLEMVNSNTSDSALEGEYIRDINTFIGDEELDALADGKWSTNENEYPYQQFLFFDLDGANVNRHRIVKYTESDDDLTADYFYIGNSRQIGKYKLEFTSTAQSDVTDSTGTSDTTGTYLDDFENTDLSMLGQDYSIVLARRTTSGGDLYAKGIKLTLMGGSVRDTLLEGETQTYTVSGKEYEVALSFVDADEGKFVVNGESTNKLQVGETYVLSDKSEVGVSEVLYQDYAGGVHSVTFFLGASKLELRDDDVSTVNGSYSLKVGSEDIDGSTVIITGTDNNVTFTVSTMELNMSTEDDYFVGAGKKLSEVITASGEEEEVLMNGALDFEYKGLTKEPSHDLRLASSTGRKYKLALYDGDNNKVDIPIAYAEDTYNLSFGEDTWKTSKTSQKRLHNWEGTTAGAKDNSSVWKNDYVIITGGTAADGSAKSYLLEYAGADRQTKTSPKITFKNKGSGETLEYAVSVLTQTGTVATIKLGGSSYTVVNASAMNVDNFQVKVDLSGDGTISPYESVDFVDYYGSNWNITYVSANKTAGGKGGAPAIAAVNQSYVTIRASTPNANDYDNFEPSHIVLNITSVSGPEVRATCKTDGPGLVKIHGSNNLLTPDGETEIAYGYTTMGGLITFTSPSSDPNEMTYAYPEVQQVPQMYITSGATKTSTAAKGDLTAVTIVDATKLDSEVASVTAQNLIVVGGPCVNTVAAELLANPADCTEGFTPGKARVKLFQHVNGNVAMLVAGYSGADTRLAGKVIANTDKVTKAGGEEVEIEGTTYSDAVVSAPSVTPK